MVRILKSIPMVVIKEGVKLSSLKRKRQQDLPTPESPIRRSFIWWRRSFRQSDIQNRVLSGLQRHRVGGYRDLLGNRSFASLP